MYNGQTFTTGNSTVNQLPAGTTLKVVGKGTVQITSIPKPVFNFGDRVMSKYGPATIARPSSRLNVSGSAGKVYYIADGTAVLRIADPETLVHLG